MLFCIIVAQPGALFLLLRLLSGKVRLTGLRTTGSDGEERGRRTNSGKEEGGRKVENVGDWLGSKIGMVRVQKVERQITRDGSPQFGKTTASYECQGSRQA